jgi:hypothetical protein
MLATASGSWEDESLDFKTNLPPQPLALGKTLKLLLAFANTPRNRDAYVIYGLSEKSPLGRQHIGADVFPPKEQIEHLIHEYTDLKDIVVDSEYSLNGYRTPFIVVPLQFSGPYLPKKPFRQAPKALDPRLCYMRAGSRIITADEVERRKMRTWGTWFLDGRYVSSTSDLAGILRRTFPHILSLEERPDLLRFVIAHSFQDSIGSHPRGRRPREPSRESSRRAGCGKSARPVR